MSALNFFYGISAADLIQRERQPIIKYLFLLILYEAAFYFACRYGMGFNNATESPFWFLSARLLGVVLMALPFYVVAVLVEQQRAAERLFRESEDRFRFMANATPALIWMSGVDHRCEFVNQAWLDFTGSTLEQELGRDLAEGIHPDERQRCRDIASAALAARRPFELEFRLHHRDGDYRWILSKAVPRYAENGDFLGHIGSAIDITERKRAEEIHQNIAHVSRLAVVGELTAMVAHEINQPLGAILSNAEAAELILESNNPSLAEIREILADIRENDIRAVDAIKRMRSLLRKHKMQVEALDMNQTIRDVIRLAEGDAQCRRIKIRDELNADLPLVAGDKIYLQQVLLNLLVNAMDAMRETPEDARWLTLRTLRYGADFVEIEVSDHGHGIAVSNMSDIFKSFFTTKKDGIGLGLSISNSIVAMHGGNLWVENNAAGGATFYFTVPLMQTVPLARTVPMPAVHV